MCVHARVIVYPFLFLCLCENQTKPNQTKPKTTHLGVSGQRILENFIHSFLIFFISYTSSKQKDSSQEQQKCGTNFSVGVFPQHVT